MPEDKNQEDQQLQQLILSAQQLARENEALNTQIMEAAKQLLKTEQLILSAQQLAHENKALNTQIMELAERLLKTEQPILSAQQLAHENEALCTQIMEVAEELLKTNEPILEVDETKQQKLKQQQTHLKKVKLKQIRLKGQLLQVLNQLVQQLESIERFKKFKSYLYNNYNSLTSQIQNEIWSQVMHNCRLWLLKHHSKKHPCPAYQLYDPNLSEVWTWFSKRIEYQWKEQTRKRKRDINITAISLDQPVSSKDDTSRTVGETTPDPKSSQPEKLGDALKSFIDEDPDGAFRAKQLPKTQATFRELLLHKIDGEEDQAIANAYGVSHSKFTSWYSRTFDLYYPYFKEWREDQFWLPPEVQEAIQADTQQVFAKKKLNLKTDPQVSFQQIVCWKLAHQSWQHIARSLQLPKETGKVILFFLETLKTKFGKLRSS